MTTDFAERERDQLYGRAWRKARAGHLLRHPLCTVCHRAGRLKRADTVDHIIPHRGDTALFWDTANWQSLCANCHNSSKQREEKSGITLSGIDIEGSPTHPDHPWNRNNPYGGGS